MTKRALLGVVDDWQKDSRARYKARKYMTIEEAEADLKRLAKMCEFVVETIKKFSSNTYDQNRKMSDDIWNGYLEAYKGIKGLIQSGKEQSSARKKKIRANKKKIAALKKQIAAMEKDFEDCSGFVLPSKTPPLS